MALSDNDKESIKGELQELLDVFFSHLVGLIEKVIEEYDVGRQLMNVEDERQIRREIHAIVSRSLGIEV